MDDAEGHADLGQFESSGFAFAKDLQFLLERVREVDLVRVVGGGDGFKLFSKPLELFALGVRHSEDTFFEVPSHPVEVLALQYGAVGPLEVAHGLANGLFQRGQARAGSGEDAFSKLGQLVSGFALQGARPLALGLARIRESAVEPSALVEVRAHSRRMAVHQFVQTRARGTKDVLLQAVAFEPVGVPVAL